MQEIVKSTPQCIKFMGPLLSFKSEGSERYSNFRLIQKKEIVMGIKITGNAIICNVSQLVKKI